MSKIDELPFVYLREEPAWSREPFLAQELPVADDLSEEAKAIVSQINSLRLTNFQMLRPNRDGTRRCPEDGDIVGYYDEEAKFIMFREHWWQLTKGDRKRMKNKTLMWTTFWEGEGARRRIKWLSSAL